MRRGDIIVNPWVSVDYCGELNPMYATIYLGNNFSLDYKGRKHRWADKVYKENAEHRCPWKVIGHIDLDEIIETAIRKAVEDEPQTEQKWTCARCGCENHADFIWCFKCGYHKEHTEREE